MSSSSACGRGGSCESLLPLPCVFAPPLVFAALSLALAPALAPSLAAFVGGPRPLGGAGAQPRLAVEAPISPALSFAFLVCRVRVCLTCVARGCNVSTEQRVPWAFQRSFAGAVTEAPRVSIVYISISIYIYICKYIYMYIIIIYIVCGGGLSHNVRACSMCSFQTCTTKSK